MHGLAHRERADGVLIFAGFLIQVCSGCNGALRVEWLVVCPAAHVRFCELIELTPAAGGYTSVYSDCCTWVGALLRRVRGDECGVSYLCTLLLWC
jgi:hypothetical protein